MADLQFEDDSMELDSKFRSRSILGSSATPAMIRGIMKLGLAKNEKAAGNILLGIIISCFLLTISVCIYFFYPRFTEQENLRKKLTPEQFNQLPQEIQDQFPK